MKKLNWAATCGKATNKAQFVSYTYWGSTPYSPLSPFRYTCHPQYTISACHNLQLVELWLQFRFAFLIFLKNFLQFWPAVSLGRVRQRSWHRDSALTLINWRLWPCPNLTMTERGDDEGECEQFQFVNTKKKKKKTNFYCIYWGRIVWATNWSIFCSSKRLPDRIIYRIYPAA